jgi:hypothetical protein
MVVMVVSGVLNGNQTSTILNSYSTNYATALIWPAIYIFTQSVPVTAKED